MWMIRILFLSIFFVSCAAQPKLSDREAMKQELRVILENSRRDFKREHKAEIDRLTGRNNNG